MKYLNINRRKQYFSFIILHFSFLMLMSNMVSAQFLTTGFDEQRLQMRVKQLDEFVKRFNYETDIQGNKIADRSNLDMRKRYIASLFDYKLFEQAKNNDDLKIYNDFLGKVVNAEKQLYLDYYDTDWYAVAECKVKLNGKTDKMKLILKTERDKQQNAHWVIASVKADFIQLAPDEIDNSKFISPVSHEINFMDLHKITTEDRANIVNYAPQDFKYDERNIFFHLVKTGQLQIEYVEHLTYHFLQIHGFIFTVQHFERDHENVGWLISELKEINETEKNDYRKSKLYLP